MTVCILRVGQIQKTLQTRNFSLARVDGMSKYRFTKARAPEYGPGKYLLLAMPAACFGLGVWQMQRRTWKINLIQELKEKTNAPPIELPSSLDEIYQLEYRKVRVRGSFDHDREIYIGPRSLFKANGEDIGGGIISSANSTGWNVITPFKLRNESTTILVNRGWVPQHMLEPSKRASGQVSGEVELFGVVRRTEPSGQFKPKNAEDGNKWMFRDLEGLARKLGTSPIFLDACDNTPQGPIGGQTRVSLRNDHMSYMITWFSMSGVTTLMWFKKFMAR